MQPIFRIGTHDYTTFLAEDGLQPVRNDLDSDGGGRNLLDGLMYRARIAQKDKWTVKFNRLPEQVMKAIAQDIDGEFTDVTLLDPKSNRVLTKTYYTSTLTYGAQRYSKDGDLTFYDGCTFNITER